MAFVCTLRGPFLPVVAAYPTLTSLIYPIGYDDEDGTPFRLYIGFGAAAGGIIEYSFCVVQQVTEDRTHDFWDSQELSAVISKADRELILMLLLEATEHMIKMARYPEVTMHTIARDLPTKALAKYRAIAQLFGKQGYRARTEKRHGQHIWWFEHEETMPSRKRSRRRR